MWWLLKNSCLVRTWVYNGKIIIIKELEFLKLEFIEEQLDDIKLEFVEEQLDDIKIEFVLNYVPDLNSLEIEFIKTNSISWKSSFV